MSQDFITALQLQLREAAVREQRRSPLAARAVRTRRRLPEPGPAAAALVAAVVLTVAALLGAVALRGERPARPEVVGVHHVADGLASLAPGFGSAWATDPIAGRVLRIDPATRRVTARVPVGGDAVLTTGAGAVWVLAGDLQLSGDEGPVRLLRIDPATNRVTLRVPVRAAGGGGFGAQEVHVAGGTVWVIGAAGALRVDARSGTAHGYVAFPGGAARGAVALGATRIAALGADGRVRTLDARTGRTLRVVRVPVTTRTALTPGRPGTLTLVGGDRITVVEAATGRRIWSAALGADVRRWTGEGDTLWAFLARAPDAPDRLVRLDAATGKRLGGVDLHEPGAAGLTRVGEELWVAAPGGRIEIVSR
jgi:PQQ-like domain